MEPQGIRMNYRVTDKPTPDAIPLRPLNANTFEVWEAQASLRHRRWAGSADFKARPGQILAFPDESGEIEFCLFGMQDPGWLNHLAAIYKK